MVSYKKEIAVSEDAHKDLLLSKLKRQLDNLPYKVLSSTD